MSTVDEFDVGHEAPPDKLDRLHEKLQEAIALEQVAKQLEEDMKAAKTALHGLREKVIPEMMIELQMDSITFAGWAVNLEDRVTGSLPKAPDKRAAAIEWLENHDGGGLIKTDVSVSFGKEERETAKELGEELERKGLPVKVESDVHPQTLLSYVRQRIKDGDEIEPAALGVYVNKFAKMKGPKA